MNPVEVREMLEKVGAIMTGHFKLSSGRHSDLYVQKQRVFEHPRLTASLGEAIAHRMGAKPGHGAPFTVVVAPAVGALTLGHSVAHAANTRFLFAERVEDRMVLRRGQQLARDDSVLVIEDVVTTGGSAAEVVKAVEDAGARVAGVACLVDRTATGLPFRLHSLLKLDARDWDPAECPQCAKGEPIDSPGSRYL